MKKTVNNIKIQNETMGVLLDETFFDETQFRIFLKLVNGCFVSEIDLFFYNGTTTLINIPFNTLKNCVIVTNEKEIDTMPIVRSKLEALVTKE